MDVVVLTALDLEYAAVRAHLTGLRTHTDANGTQYETGRFGAGRARVALALTGSGNLAAAALATRAIAWFRPKALILVGVAGGLARDVALGDVVVATRVHAYHGGRADSGGFRPRPKSWPLAHGLEQDAREIARGSGWAPPDSTTPAVHFKPLVSGEVVLDTDAGHFATLIKEHYNDAVAIDMESAGVAEAAHHNDFHRAIMVRAISDRADGTKQHTDATGWQHRAATHAAAFAIALAERIAAGPTRTGTGYRGQVEAIAPEKLLDREDELAELARFAAGHEPYVWWQAGPWAGKSALMSWFVTHPPDGVDVVSFFVTGRLAAQQDSDAFTTELTRQLAALAGEQLPDVLPPGDRQLQLLRLLDEADRRLLVVIDGLDEDTGPAHGKPSIASLLPRQPPPNVRILIASRPDPGVPDDVLDDDHPLLNCTRRELAVSPHARSMRRRAVNELNEHLRGDDLHRDVLGLVTAAGGGLTRDDLGELTGRPPYEIDRLLDGPLGRTIGSRPAPLENTPVLLFTHETLAQAAQAKFGTSVRSYRARLHTWADSYREQGWPPDTPRYLLLGYPHLLVDTDDHDRLVAIATDRRRHDRMLLRSGGDALAANEVRLTQDLLCRQPEPNLSALLVLAAHGSGLTNRNSDIPVRLPLVWMMLGHTTRAEALARGIPNHESQASSLIALAGFAARTGDQDRLLALVTEVCTLARGFPIPYSRELTIAELARTVAAAGQQDLAVSIAQDVLDGDARDRLLADLVPADEEDEPLLPESSCEASAVARSATAAWAGGDHDRAASLFEEALTRARQLDDDPVARARAAVAVVETAGAGGAVAPPAVVAGAEEIVLALTGVELLESLARLAVAAASMGDQASAHAIFVRSGRLVEQVTDLWVRDGVTRRWLLPGAFAAGEYDWALARIKGFTDPNAQAMATADLVDAAAGDHARVSSLLTAATLIVQSMTSPDATEFLLARLAVAAAGIADHERAQALATGIADGALRERALTNVAKAAMGDDPRWAVSLVRHIAAEHPRSKALASLAEVAASTGDHDRARLVVDLIPDVGVQHDALRTLADQAAEAGEHERARALASAITTPSARTAVRSKLVSRAIANSAWDQAAAVIDDLAGDPMEQSKALAELVVAIAAAGEPDRARAMAVDIDDPCDRSEMLTRLARTAAATGDQNRVRALLTEVATITGATRGYVRLPYVLAQAVEVAIAAGELDQAKALARDIAVDPYSQIFAFIPLAEATAEAGDHDTAQELAERVEAICRNLPDPARPEALGGLAVAALLTGDRNRAYRLARRIPDGAERMRALAELALAKPDAARAPLTDAVAAARTIPDMADRAGALTELVRVVAPIGQPDLLRSLIADAEAAIVAVENVEARAYLLAFLAQAAQRAGQPDAARSLFAGAEALAGAHPGGQAYPRFLIASTLEFGFDTTLSYELAKIAGMLGDLERARVLAGGIADPDERHSALAELALAAGQAGAHELATAMVQDINHAYRRDDALVALTEQATARGEHDLARSFALVPVESSAQTSMLTWLAQLATATGAHARALSLVRTMSNTADRAAGLVWLVRAAVATGEHERARTLAEGLPESHRYEAGQYLSGETPSVPGLYGWTARMTAMVDILIAAGKHEAAVAVARDIANWSSSVPDLGLDIEQATLVDAEIAAGEHERALAAARRITGPDDRVKALSRLAEAGDSAPARSALAEVLVLGRWWYESAKLVARVAPDALAPVLDELESRCGALVPPAMPADGGSAQ